MSVDTALRALAEGLDVGDDDVTIERVSATTDGAELETELTVTYPFDLFAESEAVTVTDCGIEDGRFTVDVSLQADPETLVADAPEEADVTDDGADAGDESVPAYKDPDRLRTVYAEYDSFTEMTDALDVDVTAQTVRRNMMKHGIHTPDTAEDGDTDDEAVSDTSPAAVERDTDREASEDEAQADANPEFDDTQLPDDITPAQVRDAVAESSSLHGAQTALGLDIGETRSLLQDLGVLDYVTGRLRDRTEEPDTTEIEQQIYDSLTARADGGDTEG